LGDFSPPSGRERVAGNAGYRPLLRPLWTLAVTNFRQWFSGVDEVAAERLASDVGGLGR